MHTNIKSANSAAMPITLVSALMILLMVFGGYLLRTGTTVGLLMALSVLLLVFKLPTGMRGLIRRQPFLSDCVLTGAVTVGVAQMFGNGLILGVSALTCGIILSIALPKV